jgi:hypothetical protein
VKEPGSTVCPSGRKDRKAQALRQRMDPRNRVAMSCGNLPVYLTRA